MQLNTTAVEDQLPVAAVIVYRFGFSGTQLLSKACSSANVIQLLLKVTIISL